MRGTPPDDATTVARPAETSDRGRGDGWRVEAACQGRTRLFFGIAGERPERRARREAAARELCASCPVLVPCRDAARAGRESGFWGGESEEERAAAGHPPRSISRRAVQEAMHGREVEPPLDPSSRRRRAS